MSVSIDWKSRVIYVPKADLTLIQDSPAEIREMNIDWFRYQLKGLEDDPEGMTFPDTHRHNTEATVAGLTLARVIEIINGYTVTFEDGQYAVNLVGANSNVAEKVNVNQVSVRSFNSAGLIVTSESGAPTDLSGIPAAVWGHQTAIALRNEMSRTLGLGQENYQLDQTVYDANGNLTSGRIRTFTDSSMTVVRATYQITAVFAAGKLSSYQVLKQ